MDFLGGLVKTGVGAGLGLADSWMSGWAGDYFGKKSSQYSAEQNLYASMILGDYNRKRDYEYAQKYADLNYDLAQKYAGNTAKWSVQGLRAAGLNPILAAGGGFNANLGSAASSPSGGGSVSGSAFGGAGKMNTAEVLRDLASLNVQDNTAKQIEANTDVLKAQENNIKANTAKTKVEAINEMESGGFKSDIGHLINKGWVEYNNKVRGDSDKMDKVYDDALRLLNSVDDTPSSAKSSNQPRSISLQSSDAKHSPRITKGTLAAPRGSFKDRRIRGY